MLTADIRQAAWEAANEAAVAGDLPPMKRPWAEGREPEDPSTLRPVPSQPAASYASTLPYLLATPAISPERAAAVLADRLAGLPWVASASVGATATPSSASGTPGSTAGTGHLVITVTSDALAGLAVRIPQAADCAASDTLRGLRIPAPAPATPPLPAALLSAELSWPQAQSWVTADVIARLGRKAGAIMFNERLTRGPSIAPPEFPLAAALAYAGPDAVTYALISHGVGWQPASAAELPVRHHRANPLYAVQYAHAHAASTLRQAADLGLGRGDAAEFVPRLLGHPLERALLGAMSWLPERVAWAARRGRPGEFARYLVELAGAYHDCRERCPALPFGGHSAPRDPATAGARLWLVTAARTAIAAGLELLGVSAPDRL